MDAIIDLERAAAAHWRGTEEEWLGGWLLRAAEGFTGRANSALPLGDPGLPLDDALAAVTGWYRARGLPPMIAVPLPAEGPARAEVPENRLAPHHLDNQLSERSWLIRRGPALVMTAGLPDAAVPAGLPAGAEFRVDDEPDDAWLGMYHYRGQDRQPPVSRKVLMSAAAQAFASIRRGGGREVMAIGRLSIADGWAGITAVEVNAAHRRAGLGTALTARVCAEAVRRGVRRVFLQVETTNLAARALYERCGFRYSHRYHYRVGP
jgi:ribosomal protein S18 acetylase RimI-like enzyme